MKGQKQRTRRLAKMSAASVAARNVILTSGDTKQILEALRDHLEELPKVFPLNFVGQIIDGCLNEISPTDLPALEFCPDLSTVSDWKKWATVGALLWMSQCCPFFAHKYAQWNHKATLLIEATKRAAQKEFMRVAKDGKLWIRQTEGNPCIQLIEIFGRVFDPHCSGYPRFIWSGSLPHVGFCPSFDFRTGFVSDEARLYLPKCSGLAETLGVPLCAEVFLIELWPEFRKTKPFSEEADPHDWNQKHLLAELIKIRELLKARPCLEEEILFSAATFVQLGTQSNQGISRKIQPRHLAIAAALLTLNGTLVSRLSNFGGLSRLPTKLKAAITELQNAPPVSSAPGAKA